MTKAPNPSADIGIRGLRILAVTVGFEPTVAFTTQLFESCTFGRSDTSPWTILIHDRATPFDRLRERSPFAEPGPTPPAPNDAPASVGLAVGIEALWTTKRQ